jgi:hypothetical protein
MANLTPQDYFDLYGSKRPNSNIVQTYRIRKKTNNHPNYPGSLDHIVYLVLFEGKFLKKSELYAYTYLPEYFDLPEQYNNKPGKLEISGVYKGVNLFIENPEVANSLGNCITGITVNGTQKPGGTGTTRVEIDFSYFDVKVGDDITIVINYDTSCKIDVINPEAVLGTDDNVQTNNIGEINERYKKIKEATEKKLSDEESKVSNEKQEIDLAIYKIQKKPNDQITDEEKIELQNLKEKGIKMGPEWAKRIADIKVELSNIEKNKIQEINSNKSTIREIERLVIAENLPINLTEVAIDKMGRNFDNLLLKALKIKNSNLEVFEDEFYTIEDFTFVPNESIIERDKLFGIADEIVEAAIKNFKYMDVVTDYEIIQYPWDPNDVPPEETSEQTLQVVNPESGFRSDGFLKTVRARGEYSVKVSESGDKIKLSGLDLKFLFPDGIRRELGELTLVKKEDPNDPNIIKILAEEYERQDELSDEYLEDEYVGEGLGTTLGGTLGDQTKPEQTPDYVSPSNSGSINNAGGSNLTPSGPLPVGDDADWYSLLAVCLLEDGNHPAEVAQCIYNRLKCNCGYGGRNIKQLVTAKSQFQVAFEHIKWDTSDPINGVISNEWRAINDLNTAIIAVKSYYKKRGIDSDDPRHSNSYDKVKARLLNVGTILKDRTAQQNALNRVGGRTGFTAATAIGVEKVDDRGTYGYTRTISTINGTRVSGNWYYWSVGLGGYNFYVTGGNSPAGVPSNFS